MIIVCEVINLNYAAKKKGRPHTEAGEEDHEDHFKEAQTTKESEDQYTAVKGQILEKECCFIKVRAAGRQGRH